MFIKNILRAFDRDTPIEVYMKIDISDTSYNHMDYQTVGHFMDSGLMTYMEVDEEQLFKIKDNKIIIYIK